MKYNNLAPNKSAAKSYNPGKPRHEKSPVKEPNKKNPRIKDPEPKKTNTEDPTVYTTNLYGQVLVLKA